MGGGGQRRIRVDGNERNMIHMGEGMKMTMILREGINNN